MQHELHGTLTGSTIVPGTWNAAPAPRTEYDETRGWAVQGTYRRPVSADWQLGVRLTGDWSHHPKIPNYDLMQIPRNPGNSSAYRFGAGGAREVGRSTAAVEAAYEPIWSHTWATAVAPLTTPDGTTRPAGSTTVDNRFRFHNGHLRAGLRYQASATLGTGRPSVAGPWSILRGGDAVAFASANWLAAPRASLLLEEAIVITHQLYVALPLADQ